MVFLYLKRKKKNIKDRIMSCFYTSEKFKLMMSIFLKYQLPAKRY